MWHGKGKKSGSSKWNEELKGTVPIRDAPKGDKNAVEISDRFDLYVLVGRRFGQLYSIIFNDSSTIYYVCAVLIAS